MESKSTRSNTYQTEGNWQKQKYTKEKSEPAKKEGSVWT